MLLVMETEIENELRILVLDDDANDVLLEGHALSEANICFHLVRVETQAGFLNEIERQHPDIILSDHGLPAFDGLAALSLAQANCPETPFIFVCGSQGDSTLLSGLERGASGYVPKDRLATLGATVKHAVQAAEEKARWKITALELQRKVQDLQETLDSIKTLQGLIYVCAHCKKMKDEEGSWTSLEKYVQDHTDATLSHGICPDCAHTLYAELCRSS